MNVDPCRREAERTFATASAVAHWIVGAATPTKVAARALANKLARMAWAMMARNERYQEPAAFTA